MKNSLLKKILNKYRTHEDTDPADFLTNSALLEQVEHERIVYLDVMQKQFESLQYQGIAYQTEVDIVLPKAHKKDAEQRIRVDAMYQEAGEVKHVEVNMANPPLFETINEDWDDIDVTLNPFIWNAVEFNVTGPYPDLSQLENWCVKWFDPKNRKKADKQQLKSVVHKMSAPMQTEDGWYIMVDFGSASVEAFIAFFKQCRFNDAEAIEISSRHYLERLQGNHSFASTTTNATIASTAQPI